jgi:hypothetical protein
MQALPQSSKKKSRMVEMNSALRSKVAHTSLKHYLTQSTTNDFVTGHSGYLLSRTQPIKGIKSLANDTAAINQVAFTLALH